MEFLIGFVIGMIVMFAAFYIRLRASVPRQRPIGDLRVDRSDPLDNPYLFLELDKDANINTIIKSKYALFRVKLEDYLPRK